MATRQVAGGTFPGACLAVAQEDDLCLSLTVTRPGTSMLQDAKPTQQLPKETAGMGTALGLCQRPPSGMEERLKGEAISGGLHDQEALDSLAGAQAGDLREKALDDDAIEPFTLASCCPDQGMRTRKAQALATK